LRREKERLRMECGILERSIAILLEFGREIPLLRVGRRVAEA